MDIMLPGEDRTQQQEDAWVRRELNFEEDPSGLSLETSRKLAIYLIFKGKV